MIYLLIFILLISNAYADVFSRPSGENQSKLEASLKQDNKNFYYRAGMDYNLSEQTEPSRDLARDSIVLGCDRFSTPKSIQNYVKKEIESNDISGLQDQLTNNSFVFLEYSSPTVADLLKHFDTMAHLQIAMRHGQCANLENNLNDPIVQLRKQSFMDCLRRSAYLQENIDKAFDECTKSASENGPFSNLEKPIDARELVGQSLIHVIDESLSKVQDNHLNLDSLKEIMPDITLNKDSLHINAPSKRINQILTENRNDFFKDLTDSIKAYKQNRRVNADTLKNLSVAGFPITEAQIKDLSALDPTTGALASHKIASQLAYLKTMDLYTRALEYLTRALNHPGLQSGYKKLIQQNYDFITAEMDTLKAEKDRLKDYFNFMGTILDESDKQKLKALAQIKEESAEEERKGLFNLNP